jgi:hypothetical protein
MLLSIFSAPGDEPLADHKFCLMLPAFTFEARPVVPVMDAVRVELEAIALRNGLNAIHAAGTFWGVEVLPD